MSVGRIIRVNFVTAVCLTVGLMLIALFILHPSTYLASTPGQRAPFGVAVFSAFEIAMWFYAWRHEEGYTAAAMSGFVLVTPVVALLLMPEVTDVPQPRLSMLFLGYLSLSHFAYAFSNWRELAKGPLDL
jgi:hypothetical protein